MYEFANDEAAHGSECNDRPYRPYKGRLGRQRVRKITQKYPAPAARDPTWPKSLMENTASEFRLE